MELKSNNMITINLLFCFIVSKEMYPTMSNPSTNKLLGKAVREVHVTICNLSSGRKDSKLCLFLLTVDLLFYFYYSSYIIIPFVHTNLNICYPFL